MKHIRIKRIEEKIFKKLVTDYKADHSETVKK